MAAPEVGCESMAAIEERAQRARAAESRARQEAAEAESRFRSSLPPNMVFIPGGPFRMGAEDGEANERPTHEVRLSPYAIDRTEVTAEAYGRCARAGACSAAQSRGTCNADSSRRQDHPINCVDWAQAEAYCRWVGGRLPTEAEWEYAARGSDGRPFPWGSAESAGRACAGFTFKEHTCSVGTHPTGASPFDVQDMAGNVWEWVADWFGPYDASSAVNPTGPSQGHNRVLRGGGPERGPVTLLRTTFRNKNAPTARNAAVGFRCARGL